MTDASHRRRRRFRPTARQLLATLAVLLVIVAAPPVRSRVKGSLLALEMLPAGVRPLSLMTPDPRRSEAELPGVTLDRYRPRGFSEPSPVVVVHGANPGGKDDPRVVEFAMAVARTGRTVIVPQLALRNERLDPADRTRILHAIRFAGRNRPTGVIAFSYGGGLMLAALGADPERQRDVAFVATVGTYFDVRHIVQGVTTNTVPADARTARWEPAREARQILVGQLASLLPSEEGAALERAWLRRDPADLSPGTRAAYELLANRDPERFDELERRLPEQIRTLARQLSPSQFVEQIRVPVFALHSRNDPAAPATESRLLVKALRDRVDTRLALIGSFEHVTPRGSVIRQLGDAWRVARFAGQLLAEQEGWPRP